MKTAQKIVAVWCVLLVWSCSSGSSSDTDLGNTSAMVAAAFSSSGSASVNQAIPIQLLQTLVDRARAQSTDGGDTNTCEESDSGPENVSTTLTGSAGTYGAAGDSVTITDADAEFCETTEGEINANADDLLFATFSVSSATVTCDDDTSATMTGAGIWRNRDDLGYYPQIYGAFTITMSDGSGDVDCSIAVDENGVVAEASCSDTSGVAITLTDDITCTIDAGNDDSAVPSDPAGENG